MSKVIKRREGELGIILQLNSYPAKSMQYNLSKQITNERSILFSFFFSERAKSIKTEPDSSESSVYQTPVCYSFYRKLQTCDGLQISDFYQSKCRRSFQLWKLPWEAVLDEEKSDRCWGSINLIGFEVQSNIKIK